MYNIVQHGKQAGFADPVKNPDFSRRFCINVGIHLKFVEDSKNTGYS